MCINPHKGYASIKCEWYFSSILNLYHILAFFSLYRKYVVGFFRNWKSTKYIYTYLYAFYIFAYFICPNSCYPVTRSFDCWKKTLKTVGDGSLGKINRTPCTSGEQIN